MEALIQRKLATFLRQRQARFQNVTEEQRDEWAQKIVKQMNDTLDDIDIFYDNKPESVEETRPM